MKQAIPDKAVVFVSLEPERIRVFDLPVVSAPIRESFPNQMQSIAVRNEAWRRGFLAGLICFGSLLTSAVFLFLIFWRS